MASSSSSSDWLDIATGSTNYAQEYYRLEQSWDWLDPEPEYKPPMHQKIPRMKIQQLPNSQKGIGYVDQFRGHRYPIGKRK